MSTAEAFAISCALEMACYPLTMMNMYVPRRKGNLRSVTRIQAFLTLDELEDPREIQAPTAQQLLGSPTQPLAIELNDVSVTSPADGPILKQVNIRIPRSSLAMMWGPISCGKSTLLKLLLGEVGLNAGTVSVAVGTISYCSQELFIPDCTILEIILGTLDLIAGHYRAVLNACALDGDLATLPESDRTRTGANGCNLSVGLRQKLVSIRYQFAGLAVTTELYIRTS